MIAINKLESAVLWTMCLRTGTAALRAQVQGATVLSRDNTGAGFYTTLRPNCNAAPIEQKIIGDVVAEINGLQSPMIFLLFVSNGYIDKLEGAAITDSTVDVDFNDVDFKILNERQQQLGLH
jgi:hypothetical protein